MPNLTACAPSEFWSRLSESEVIPMSMQRCGIDAIEASLDAGEDITLVLALKECDDPRLVAQIVAWMQGLMSRLALKTICGGWLKPVQPLP